MKTMKYRHIFCFIIILSLIISYPMVVKAIGPRESTITSHGVFVSKDNNDEIVRIDASNLISVAQGLDEVDSRLDASDEMLQEIELALRGPDEGVYSATEGDVLEGKTFSSGVGLGITGTMPNRSTTPPSSLILNSTTPSGNIGADGYSVSGSIALTEENNANGYYNNNISFDLTDYTNDIYSQGYAAGLNRNTTYGMTITYHVHSTSTNSATATANSFDAYNTANAALSKATQSSTKGGCFNSSWYTYRANSPTTCGATLSWSHDGKWYCDKCGGLIWKSDGTCETHGSVSKHRHWYADCQRCGKRSWQTHTDYNLNQRCDGQVYATGSGSSVPSGYTATSAVHSVNCGYTQGQVLQIVLTP